ncbi:MAG: ABC transporter ATP-binding protein [Planctomycetes bacterium]|nr:ABC transporter ATP-binding protein [Planctomycetota bacterium]
MITVENVTKLYGLVIGVNDITMSLEPGAYGLLGPNGSGKTTLLNLLTGQLRTTLGRVRVLDEHPWNNSDLFRRIGVCPATESMYANVSGLDWVRYQMELHGFSRTKSQKLAEDALETVDMTEAMHRDIGGYSRGMRQRTKIAQAIAHDPDLLILDEPFMGLDPIGRHEMTTMLKAMVRDGKMLLLASHILHEVEAITDSFLLICGGRLLASGSSEEVNSLLADAPNEIRIRCNNAAELARRILAEDIVDAIKLEEEGRVLVLTTKNPATVYKEIPGWAKAAGVQVSELTSSIDSLETLFDSLLKIHRGEM